MSENKSNKAKSFIEEKFLPAAVKVGSQRHLLALRDGIIMIMPLLILGAFSMIIAEFPFQPFLDLMAKIFGPNWNSFEGVIMNATYGIVALVACFGVASSLVNSYKVDGTPAGMIAIAAFFITSIPAEFMVDGKSVAAWAIDSFTALYLFTALIIALITGEIYRILVQRKLTIKLPSSVPPAVSRQFTALVPGVVILIFFLIIRNLFALTAWGSFPQFVKDVISTPLRGAGTSYIGTMVAVFVEHILWSLGLHGSSIVIFPIFEPMWIENIQENLKGAHHIVTQPFYENGIWIGGSGATLPAVVYMLVFAKSKLLKQVGRIGIAPGIFNINEPITFGLPIVLNPVLMIPFFLSPMVAVTIQYFGTLAGIFPYCNKTVPWTTPFFISGFLSTGSLMGVVAQIVSFAVVFIIYLPFIRFWDIKNYKMEMEAEKAA